jgi:hypothetical protein
MKNLFATLVVLTLCFTPISSLFAQAIEDLLFDLPGVRFEALENVPEGCEGAWELAIRQPIDHNNPEQGHFYQRVFLTHRSDDAPIVMVTEGYNRGRNYMSEIADLLDANQIIVEHRYFGESTPDSVDYKYLNIRQAAADLHNIRQVLGAIYPADWVASGISKGGQTTIYYRYLYPDDVEVSVPYVAPINLALEDTRIYDFLDTVGTDACRAGIAAVQRRILTDYDESALRLKWHAKGAGVSFGEYLTFEEAFEYAVLEYPFSFWQWGADCSEIPADPATAPLDTVMEHFLTVSGLDFFADESMEAYASHYVQCAVEFGYYSYQTEHLSGLLRALPEQLHPSAIFTPRDRTDIPAYDGGALAAEVMAWLETDGNRFIHIHGASDTWNATAYRPSAKQLRKLDARTYFLPGQDHAGARFKNLTEEERSEALELIRKWLDEN